MYIVNSLIDATKTHNWIALNVLIKVCKTVITSGETFGLPIYVDKERQIYWMSGKQLEVLKEKKGEYYQYWTKNEQVVKGKDSWNWMDKAMEVTKSLWEYK